jgi:hypothetical protein
MVHVASKVIGSGISSRFYLIGRWGRLGEKTGSDVPEYGESSFVPE